MNQNQFLKQGVIAIVDISFYTIEDGELKALHKRDPENEIHPSVLKSIKKLYPNTEITGKDFDDENGSMVYKIENKNGITNPDLKFNTNGNSIETGEFIDINSAV
jgi:hypothetical protein